MMVTVMIATIFFGVFATVIYTTFNTLRTGDERVLAQQNARTAIDWMSREITQAEEINPPRFEEGSFGRLAYGSVYDDSQPFSESQLRRQSDDDGGAEIVTLNDVTDNPMGWMALAYGTFEILEPERSWELNPYAKHGFDVRPLNPNRLSILKSGAQYYRHTNYVYWDDITNTPQEELINLNDRGRPVDPSDSFETIVTFEHQVIPGNFDYRLAQEDYADIDFLGRVKRFQIATLKTSFGNYPWYKLTGDSPASAFNVFQREFCIARSFEVLDPIQVDQRVPPNSTFFTPFQDATSVLQSDSPGMTMPVADHIIDLRFRYFGRNEYGQEIEIRYDPDPTASGFTYYKETTNDDGEVVEEFYPICPNLPGIGVYRYYDPYGNELDFRTGNYNDDTGIYEITAPDGEAGDYESRNHWGGVNDKMIFEGWRYIDTIEITVRAASGETLDEFRSTIYNESPALARRPDYKMGFTSMAVPGYDRDSTYFNPGLGVRGEKYFYNVNNYRRGPNGDDAFGWRRFDFSEPVVNPDFNPGEYITLQKRVRPPIIASRAWLLPGYYLPNQINEYVDSSN
jgi:hypothetical protein